MLYTNPKVGDKVIGREVDEELVIALAKIDPSLLASSISPQANYTGLIATVISLDRDSNNNIYLTLEYHNRTSNSPLIASNPISIRFIPFEEYDGIYKR